MHKLTDVCTLDFQSNTFYEEIWTFIGGSCIFCHISLDGSKCIFSQHCLHLIVITAEELQL